MTPLAPCPPPGRPLPPSGPEVDLRARPLSAQGERGRHPHIQRLRVGGAIRSTKGNDGLAELAVPLVGSPRPSLVDAWASRLQPHARGITTPSARRGEGHGEAREENGALVGSHPPGKNKNDNQPEPCAERDVPLGSTVVAAVKGPPPAPAEGEPSGADAAPAAAVELPSPSPPQRARRRRSRSRVAAERAAGEPGEESEDEDEDERAMMMTTAERR